MGVLRHDFHQPLYAIAVYKSYVQTNSLTTSFRPDDPNSNTGLNFELGLAPGGKVQGGPGPGGMAHVRKGAIAGWMPAEWLQVL